MGRCRSNLKEIASKITVKEVFMNRLGKVIFSVLVGLAQLSHAQSAEKNHEPRQHKAHQHGLAKIGIAFEGTRGKIDLDTAAEAIIGFEYAAKSKKDKKVESDQLSKLEKSMGEMINFDAALNCKINMESSEIRRTGPHADLEATFDVKCDKSPKDSTVKFNFQKVFPRMKTVEVEVLISDLQLTTTVKKDDTSFELKN